MSGGACTEGIDEKGGFFANECFGTVFTLLAQFRFRCVGSVAPAEDLRAPNIISVGAKCFRCAEVVLQPKTYEPPDGNISTVGAKCFRCTEVLLQPKTYEPPDGNTSTVGAKCQSEEIGLCATGRGVMKFYEAGAALAQDLGADFATQPYYVAIVTPVIQYYMGGLEIEKIQQSWVRIPSPFLASTQLERLQEGVHGNNRLGGNSLLDCVVFGRVVGVACAWRQ